MGNTVSTEEPASDPSQNQGKAEQQVAGGGLPSALVICGPSGVGKGTIIKALMESADKFGFSCSHTTRAPRPGEEDGKHYYFTTKEKFEAGIEKGAFLEHAEVHGKFYGTSAAAVRKVSSAGKCCILDIDVQGARQVRQSKLQAIFVCITPPSREELERRLRDRGTESEAQVQTRLKTAETELASVNEPGLYDYIICNDSLERAGAELQAVAERALKGLVGRPADQSPAASPSEAAPQESEIQAAPAGPAPQAGSSTPQATSPARSQPGKAGQSAPPPASPSAAATPTSPAAAASASGKAQGTPCPGVTEPVMCVAQSAAMARWRGQVALVTGASAGIGWVVCQTLAAAGMRVVAVARRRDRLEALQQDLVSSGIAITDFLPIVCDISKEAEVVAVPRIIAKRWPGQGIDVLVNNAGLGRNNASLCSGVTSSWVEMISTNVLGLCMFTRAAVQDMRARGQYGHIINISSMAGHRMANAANGGAFYCATKHAVRALTEGLRQEARTAGIPLRVTEVSPGVVDTEFHTVSSYGKPQSSPVEAPLQAADVAHAVLYALSAPAHVEINDVLMRPVSQPN